MCQALSYVRRTYAMNNCLDLMQTWFILGKMFVYCVSNLLKIYLLKIN